MKKAEDVIKIVKKVFKNVFIIFAYQFLSKSKKKSTLKRQDYFPVYLEYLRKT